MKKLLILILLFLPIVASAQIGRYPFYTAPVVVQTGDTLSAEMITNGTFTIIDNWVVDYGPAFSIGSGIASYDFSIGNGYIRQYKDDMIDSVLVNTTYRIEFDLNIDITDAEYAWIGFHNYGYSIDYKAPTYFGSDGHYVVRFTTGADISGSGILISTAAFAGGNLTIDNVSMKRVL